MKAAVASSPSGPRSRSAPGKKQCSSVLTGNDQGKVYRLDQLRMPSRLTKRPNSQRIVADTLFATGRPICKIDQHGYGPEKAWPFSDVLTDSKPREED